MIRSSEAVAAAFAQGRTVARVAELTGGTHFHWVMADTNEPVRGTALKTLEKRGVAAVIARDICGDPMQYGAA